MAKRKPAPPTLWEVPDELWSRMALLLNRLDPPARTGRKRADRRRAMDGIVFHLRTGCQWNGIPRVYGDDSTIFRCFTRWCKLGFFRKLWAQLVRECDDLKDVQWKWQSADCMLGKARFGGALLDPTPRIAPKMAQKRAW